LVKKSSTSQSIKTKAMWWNTVLHPLFFIIYHIDKHFNIMNYCLLQTFQWQKMASTTDFFLWIWHKTRSSLHLFSWTKFLSFAFSIQERSCSQSYHSFLTIDSIRKAKREDGTLTTPDLQRDDVSYEPGMFYSGDMMIMQSQKMISPSRQDFPAKKVQARTSYSLCRNSSRYQVQVASPVVTSEISRFGSLALHPLPRPSLRLVVTGRSPNSPLLMICSSLPSKKVFHLHTKVISEVCTWSTLGQKHLQGSNISLSTRQAIQCSLYHRQSWLRFSSEPPHNKTNQPRTFLNISKADK